MPKKSKNIDLLCEHFTDMFNNFNKIIFENPDIFISNKIIEDDHIPYDELKKIWNLSCGKSNSEFKHRFHIEKYYHTQYL